MLETSSDFSRVAIEPTRCLSMGWEMIKGQFWIFFAITLCGILLASFVPFGILAGPMYCGIFFALFRLERGETLTFEMLFKGFDYFTESLIATLILIGVGIVIAIPMYIAMMVMVAFGIAGAQGEQETTVGILLVIAIIFITVVILALSLFVGVLGIFIYPLIVDRRLKAIPAIKASIAAGWAHFGGLFALAALLAMISIVAMMLCYVPVFFVAPLAFSSIAVAYRKIFPSEVEQT